jgi:hypothetical protein
VFTLVHLPEEQEHVVLALKQPPAEQDCTELTLEYVPEEEKQSMLTWKHIPLRTRYINNGTSPEKRKHTALTVEHPTTEKEPTVLPRFVYFNL